MAKSLPTPVTIGGGFDKGGATLFLADAAVLVADLLADGLRPPSSLALVTDPPYGIGFDRKQATKGRKNGYRDFGRPATDWDKERPKASLIRDMVRIGDHAIVWGGNYFADLLPASQRWLVWDKGQRDFSLADVELAWTSQDKAARAFTYPRSLALQDGKEHPTQKPVALMDWCMGFLPRGAGVVDPFMGSGTTGVSAIKDGRGFVGCERDPHYFEIACRRIQAAWQEPRMEMAQAPTREQLSLLD